MTDSDAAREREALDLFEQWLEWPESERAARLALAVGDDADLAARVARLIEAEVHAAGLPTLPPEPRGETVEPQAPDRVGAYRLVEVIGRGGMGSVHLGERADGLFEQTVAIKLMRPGLFSARAQEQFSRERQILARLRHPHIAQLFDGGVNEDGLPYIVLERVDGVDIDRHCRQHQLGDAERIDLIDQAADALAQAHGQLVVHADIKPSNVLVDRDFGVKLVDFGISRFADDSLESGGTGLTEGYASPQQQAGEPASVQDDIYALGRLAQRLVDRPQDAEWQAVVAKATAPEAATRYATMSALRDDLRRWRLGRPVLARPRTFARTIRLFARRNRARLMAAACVAAVLVGVGWMALDRAREAEQRFAETRSMTRYLLGDVASRSEALPGSGDMRAAIAARSLSALNTLGSLDNADPALRLDFADAYRTVAEIFAADDVASAANAADKAFAAVIAARRLYAVPQTDPALAARARIGDLRASLLEARLRGLVRSEYQAASTLIADVDRGAGAITDPVGRQLLLAEAHSLAGAIAGMTNQYDSAVASSRQALALLGPLRHASGDQRVRRALLADRAWAEIGDARWYGHDDKRGAADAYRAALAVYDDPLLPVDARIARRKSHAVFNLASSLFETGQSGAALTLMQRALADNAAYRSIDGSVAVRHQENTLTMEYANQLAALGRNGEADEWYDRSIAGRRAVASRDAGNYTEVRSLPVGLRVVGEYYLATGRRTEGCRILREADQLWTALNVEGRLAPFDQTDAAAQTKAALARCVRHVP